MFIYVWLGICMSGKYMYRYVYICVCGHVWERICICMGGWVLMYVYICIYMGVCM